MELPGREQAPVEPVPVSQKCRRGGRGGVPILSSSDCLCLAVSPSRVSPFAPFLRSPHTASPDRVLPPVPVTLGGALVALRTERAWSQQHLADAARVSLRTVQRAERGQAVAGETLLALAAALDVDVQALVAARRAAVLAGTAPPLDSAGPFRRWPLDPERLAWVGLVLAFPLLWFAVGAAVYTVTGWDGALPAFVEADGREFRLASEAVGVSVLGAALAGLLVNLAALAVRRDSGLNARLIGAAIAGLVLVHLVSFVA